MDKTGKSVSLSFVLGPAQAQSDSVLDFSFGRGLLSYNPPLKMVVASTSDSAGFASSPQPLMFCLGILEGQGARGILMSATNAADLEAQIRLIPTSAQSIPPKTPDALLTFARTWGLKVGTCSLKRLK